MISKLFDIEGLNVLITGSSRGIGYMFAEGMGKCGANIILNGRNRNSLDEAVETLSSQGINVCAYDFDVSNPEEVCKSTADIIEDKGPVDVLINNAGIQIRWPLEDFNYEDWQKVMTVNVNSAFLVSKAVVKPMIERRKGKIINTCSLMSEVARPSIAAYTASKGGIKNLTKAMATEWARYDIQVNGIGPGYFSSEMTKALVEDERFSDWLCKRTPAGRWGQLEELLGTAVFLASDASNFVNGQIIYVDGGILACI